MKNFVLIFISIFFLIVIFAGNIKGQSAFEKNSPLNIEEDLKNICAICTDLGCYANNSCYAYFERGTIKLSSQWNWQGRTLNLIYYSKDYNSFKCPESNFSWFLKLESLTADHHKIYIIFSDYGRSIKKAALSLMEKYCELQENATYKLKGPEINTWEIANVPLIESQILNVEPLHQSGKEEIKNLKKYVYALQSKKEIANNLNKSIQSSHYKNETDPIRFTFYVPIKKGEPQLEQRTAKLSIKVQNNQGGIVRGAICKVKNLDSNEVFEITVDEEGMAKKEFKAKEGVNQLQLRILEVVLKSSTKYSIPLEGTLSSYIHQDSGLVVPVNRDVTLNTSNGWASTIECKIPLFRTTISAMRWSERESKWVAVSPIVQIRMQRARKPLFLVSAETFQKMQKNSAITIYLPPKPVIEKDRLEVLGYDQSTKLKDLQLLIVPESGAANYASVTLMLCDDALKIARIRQNLYDYLKDLIGEDAAKRICNVHFIIDKSIANPRYINGEIRIPPSIDLTQDEFSESLMHEWGHHIVEVLYADNEIEAQLGGPHEPWTPAATQELAWDEGRAHFFGNILTRGLGLPFNPDGFSLQEGKNSAKIQGHGADRVESVATCALLDYYLSAGFKKTADVVQDFFATHDACRKSKNHPPRTTNEFFQVKRQMIQKQIQSGQIAKEKGDKILQQLERIRREYAIGQ